MASLSSGPTDLWYAHTQRQGADWHWSPFLCLLVTFQFHRGRPQLQSGGGEAESNEWDLPEAKPTDTVPARLAGSQREMKCINGQSVPLQVQVRFQSKAKQNRSSPAPVHSQSRRRAGRAGGYSRCSYILRLFPPKHPLHESDILFTEEKDRRAFRFPPLARPDRLLLLRLFFYGQRSLKVFGYQSGSL